MPDLSYLEQWDSPEKYYGGAPDCPECGCEMDYEKNDTWLCDECGRDGEVTRLEWKGTEKGGMVLDLQTKETIPYEEYTKYWGNYNCHVVLDAVVEEKCDHCGSWVMKDSLGSIDFMEDDDWETGIFMDGELEGLKGYQLDVATELLNESRKDDSDAA